MEIKNLKNTPIGTIVKAIGESFEDYFVPMPSELSYWENRFIGARVNLELSFGMFEQDKLVGFVIHGIDESGGFKTAFNTGTGVTREIRGQAVTDRLYQFALPLLKEQGITRCSLEVIEKNERAIHVYERIGFTIRKRLKCFKGNITQEGKDILVREIPFTEIAAQSKAADHYYSWDNTSIAIRASGDMYKTYRAVSAAGKDAGYFIMNPANGYLAQFEPCSEKATDTQSLLNGVALIAPHIRINNVDTNRTPVISSFLKAGLDNYLDQYEMQLMLS